MVRPIQLMIVGTQKTGTTSLFQYLKQNAAIVTHPQREMSFFVNDAEYERGYAQMFQKYFPAAKDHQAIILAKHVSVMDWPNAVQRLYEHNPKIHVVALLRHPVDRAYSSYWYARRRGWETLKDFSAALQAEPERLQQNFRTWHYCAYVYSSTYYQHIERLYERFGQNNVHVFLTEDLKDNALGLCQKLSGLFGIEQGFAPEVTRHHNTTGMARSETLARLFARFVRSDTLVKRMIRPFVPNSLTYKFRHAVLRFNDKDFTPPQMSTAIRTQLLVRFQPSNERLAKLLGRDLSHWER